MSLRDGDPMPDTKPEFVWCSACREYHSPFLLSCKKKNPGGWVRSLMRGPA